MPSIASFSRRSSTSSSSVMGFPKPKRFQQQNQQQNAGRKSSASTASSSSSASSAARVPRLERRNAAKNIDYDASAGVSWASSSSEDFAAAVARGGTRSLDVSPTAYSNQTSFRIEGVDGEVDLLCRSLGLSGPEDFAIPADAWAASKVRSVSENFNYRSRLFDPPPPPDIAAAVVDVPPDSLPPDLEQPRVSDPGDDVEKKIESKAEGKSGGNGGSTGSEGGGIRGARPPVLQPPAPPNPVLPLPPARSSGLTPRPAISVPVLEKTGSAWDLLRSFAPDDDDDEEATPRRSEEEEAAEIRERDAEGDDELRQGETVEDLNDSCSSSTHGDDSSSTTTETMFVISPNGRFKRHITSWMRGVMLGSGSFGTVYEGISDDGFFFAVKEVSLLDQGSNTKQCILQLEQEIALLSQFEHENIVQYFGTDKEEAKLYIFLELVTQGSLASLYQRYHLRDSQVSAYTRQILNGLNYLHERNVVHRDIKCANILVDASGSVKLADFGLAKEITKWNMLKSCKGSVYWMAPEVVNPKKTYGPAADIWSLGCTVLEMLTRQVPYPNLEWAQAFFKIGHGERPQVPSSLSRDARDFIERCVRVDPEDRPSASQLLDHPFVRRPTPPSPEGSIRSSRSVQ